MENRQLFQRDPVVSKLLNDGVAAVREAASDNGCSRIEVHLKPGADAQDLLREVSARLRVNRFELVEPSLEQIFIETVSKTDA